MKGAFFAALALTLAAGAAWGDTLQLNFSDTNTSKITSLWFGPQNQNNACINTGADVGYIIASPPATGWNFGASLFYTDLPSNLTTGPGVVESASLNLRETWWNNNGFSNVELRRLDSPVTWIAGTGTNGGRWSNPSPYSGAAHYFADFDSVTQTGTTWSGAHVDQWSFNSPANAIEFATWPDGVTPVMGDLLSTGTIIASGGCLLLDGTLVGSTGRNWSFFDATVAVQKWATGAWQNTGMMLWMGNAVELRPDGSMNQTLQFRTNVNSDGYQGGLVITYTTARMGDANKDGLVDMSDYIIWFNNFGATVNTTWTMADFNADGIVDMTDYVTWFSNFGETGPGMSSLASAGSESPSIPEPMTVALVALAAPLILRKRRRAGIG